MMHILWTLGLAATAGVMPAQCAQQWGAVLGIPGTSGSVQAMVLWDPDGGGPAAELLVVGGTMNVVAAQAVTYVATYDRASRTWAPLGNPGYFVNALVVLPSGDLVAAGSFANVVRWNGTAWVPLGGPHDGLVRALAVLPSGELVAAGLFTTIGGVTAADIARWDGAAWSPLDAGLTGGTIADRGVHALAVLTNGDLVAGGKFDLAGGLAANGIASWNGIAWSSLGSGISSAFPDPTVRALLPVAGGGVVAAGSFTTAGTVAAASVALWTGTTWAPFGSLGMHVYALRQLPNGLVLAAGSFAGSIAAWSGTAWQAGNVLPNGSVLSMQALPTGEIALGGSFAVPFHGLAVWNGSSLEPPNAGITMSPFDGSRIATATAMADGTVLVGGRFGGIDGVAARNVARRNGGAWQPLGTGIDGEIECAVELPNGDVVVGGMFASAGGAPAHNVARWTGTTWSPLGAGTDQVVHALAVLPNGDVIAGGDFTLAGGIAAQRIARWNGSAWAPLGAGLSASVRALALLPGGDLVAGGQFGVVAGVPTTVVARWNGSAWASMGTFTGMPPVFPPWPGSPPYVTCLLTLRGGDLLVAGGFTAAGGVAAQHLARWNGVAWSDYSAGAAIGANALLELPDGDVLAAGGSGMGVLRRVGAGWTSFLPPAARTTRCLASSAAGELVLGGELMVLGTAGSGFLTTGTPGCPAAAAPSGTGCSGSAGPLALAVTALPWVGSRFTARSTGVPANAAVIVASGFAATAIPLVQLLPEALPGCDLLVAADALGFTTPVAGIATSELTIPAVPALVGVVVHHQHVVVELGAFVPIAAVTSTNALVLTVGML